MFLYLTVYIPLNKENNINELSILLVDWITHSMSTIINTNLLHFIIMFQNYKYKCYKYRF